jgi:hypothetical protein
MVKVSLIAKKYNVSYPLLRIYKNKNLIPTENNLLINLSTL